MKLVPHARRASPAPVLLGALLACVLLSAPVARAQVIHSAFAYTPAHPPPQGARLNNQASGASFGFEFRVNTPILVTALATYVAGPHAKKSTQTVALFREGQERYIASASIGPGPAPGAVFRYLPPIQYVHGQSLSGSVPLSPGLYLIVGYGYSVADPFFDTELSAPTAAYAPLEDTGEGAVTFTHREFLSRTRENNPYNGGRVYDGESGLLRADASGAVASFRYIVLPHKAAK